MNPIRRLFAARTRIAVVLAAAFPLASSADSPSIELNTVVVTGSRVEHNSFDLPAAVDVVDASRIGADQAKVNASEALAAVPGITVQNRQNYAQDLQISSRGFGARSAFGVRGIRLVADGIPASMPDGQGQAATFNLDRAERVEVMRGPMSAVYGNHAGGVIQLFTPDGKGAPSVEGNFSGGSYGTWKADAASQGEVNGVGYVIDTSRFHTEGYRDHSSVTRDQSMAKLSFAPDDYSKLSFVANYLNQPDAQDPLGLNWNQYKANPRSVDPNALTFNTRKSIEHVQGGLNFERRFGDDLLHISAYVGQRSVTQFQSIPITSQRGAASTARNSGGVIAFDRDFSGVEARWTDRAHLGDGNLTTTIGANYEIATDDRKGYENFLGGTGTVACGASGRVCGVIGNLRRDETDKVSSTDFFAQTEWERANWLLSAGVRRSSVRFSVDDHYIVGINGNDSGNVTYSRTTPTIGATYKVNSALNVYASAARGFEAPTFNELFYSGSGGTFNFGLKAATSRHLEVGMKAFVGTQTRLDLAIFKVDTQNELVVDQSSGGRTSYKNAGSTLRQGIELALDSIWSGGFTTRLAYTGLRATYENSFTSLVGTPATAVVIPKGNRLPGIPASTVFGEVAWHHPSNGFHTALEIIARDKVYVDDTNGKQVVATYPGDRVAHSAPSYAVANLRFGVERRVDQWTLKGFLRIDNLFDKQYIGSVIVGDGNGRFYESAPGRTWLVGASARYAF